MRQMAKILRLADCVACDADASDLQKNQTNYMQIKIKNNVPQIAALDNIEVNKAACGYKMAYFCRRFAALLRFTLEKICKSNALTKQSRKTHITSANAHTKKVSDARNCNRLTE